LDPHVTPLLAVRGLHKSYAAPVLSDLDLEVRSGEVHALVGANGAGKSTLARIVSGLVQPDGGAMWLGGAPYAPHTKAAAEAAGVHMVQQELNLIGTLSVAENLFLNRLPRRFGLVHRGMLHRDARRALSAVGLPELDPETRTGALGVGHQQLVEIAAALSRECRLLILDEPTAALTDPEIETLFAHVERLRSEGVGIIYISHRMEEIRRIADRVTVLRDGRVIETRAAPSVSIDSMVQAMVGRSVVEAMHRDTRPAGAMALRVERLHRGERVRDVSFEVRRGEVLGFAGLVGSGRTETLRAVFGADRPESGRVLVGDPPRPVRIGSPRDAVRAGIGLIPEDRKQDGLLLTQPLRVNVTLARMDAVSRTGWVRASAERREAERFRSLLDVRCASVEQPVAELSGGNQQKVVIARWLLRDCDVLLFDEPTRGIDVAAKAAVYTLLDDLAAAGKAIVVASSEMEELMAISDRIAVLSAGRIAATFPRGGWSQDGIMEAAFSGHLPGSASGARHA
jgi:ribose transport system ATP-binding protein